ncbi:MAG: hypothetical protein ACR2OU_14565 [Thermomicrobiales bacterium]
MSSAEPQKARRIAMVIRQALLMIVAVIEKEFGITSKTGGRIRVEFVDDRENVRKEIPPPDSEPLV